MSPSHLSALDTVQFESRLSRALERVRATLGEEKSYAFAGKVHHQYQDKYLLAEKMTNMAAASQLNCLCSLGITLEGLEQLRQWSQTSTVSLRFRAEERCTYDREESREVEAPRKHVDEVSVGGVVRAAWTSKVVNKITEYFWKYEASYEILAVRGVGAGSGDCVSILSRTGRDELKTTSKAPPHPCKVPADFEVNVSWLFRHLEAGTTTPTFNVDRSHKSCHTPRHNPETEAAWQHFRSVTTWVSSVVPWLKKILQIQPDPRKSLDVAAVDANSSILVPVLPLLEDRDGVASPALEGAAAGEAAACASSAPNAGVLACLRTESTAVAATAQVMSSVALNQLLAEEQRALSERRTALGQVFPSGPMVASLAEASLIMLLLHCSEVCRQWFEAMDYIESMLRSQLIAAIGKEVSPADFAEYMRFHSRKLFAEAYMPAPFCFAVRRSDQHSPEGTLSIEEEVVGPGGDSNIAAPIVTMCSKSAKKAHAMEFALNASAKVSFAGDRFLHAWLSHQFSGQSGAKLSLVAKTRQFSSMLVLVGRITSATTFHPKYAAILQNKDELTIPLDLSTIPTPKEFKDAIESLSPEQQEFAKAFRAMQLESTLFGILVIHIKPQLEKVLNLPEDSLTKEIKLTQDLMQLFTKYQIPSDLLSFDASTGTEGMEVIDATPADRLVAVKAHVGAMHEMIEEAKREEVHERQMQRSYISGKPQTAPPVDLMGCVDQMITRGESLQTTKKKFGGAALKCMFVAAPEAIPTIGLTSCLQQQQAAAAPAPPLPVQAAQPTQHQHQAGEPAKRVHQEPQHEEEPQQPAAEAEEGRDYTRVPREMDVRFEELDTDGALRPTIINPGERWTKKAQKALLASPSMSSLGSKEQKSEKSAAFDLLDALTKSGAIAIDHASLHVVVAATHCFDKTVTETVVQDNMNPIEKVERSMLIMASTIHQKPAAALVQRSQLPRLQGASPALFLTDEATG